MSVLLRTLMIFLPVLLPLGAGAGGCVSGPSPLDSAPRLDAATPDRDAARRADLVLAGDIGRRDALAPDASPKLEREGYLPYPNQLRSANFVIKWGSANAPSSKNLGAILAALEQVWQAEITQMGYPQPHGTQTYLMNVYVSGTGVAQPPNSPGYAYQTTDPQGYPVLVFSRERTSDSQLDKSLNSTAHEFFHTVQQTMGAYAKSSSWWFEASATWMAEEIFPQTFGAGYLLGLASYSFLPHLSLAHYEPPQQNWTLVQGHQYGAFIFCRFLTEHVADAKLLHESWTSAGSEPDALLVLEALLAKRGKVLVDELGRFAAHNAVWDYAGRTAYLQALAQMAASYPADDHRVAVKLPATGTALKAAPTATLPEHAGYNLIRLANPAASPVKISFQGDATGSNGSPAAFSVWTVVATPAGKPTYASVLLVDRKGSLSVAATPADEIFLAVVAWSKGSPQGEVFPYQYAMEMP